MVVAGYAPSGYGWGEPTHETETCHSAEPAPKNAQSPTSRVHAVLGYGVANEIISGKSTIKVSPSILSLQHLSRFGMHFADLDSQESLLPTFLQLFHSLLSDTCYRVTTQKVYMD